MKSILYSVCIGSLALALTAGGAQAARDKRSDNAKPQQRSAKVQAARPANTGRSMSAHRNVSAAQYRQRSYAKPHASSNAVVEHNSGLRAVREPNLASNERMRERNSQEFRARRDVAAKTPAARAATTTAATVRDRNASVDRNRNLAVNRDRNVAVNRTSNFDANRERNVAVNRTRNADVNRFRNTNEFRSRNNVAFNRERNFNRTENAAFYRRGNVRITNSWRGDAFRGQRYATFRNYQRQWHDRSWWRSHYNRIIF